MERTERDVESNGEQVSSSTHNQRPPDHLSCSSSNNEKKIKKGGWGAIKYILVNETFEKLASMSLIANITVYLRTKYNMEGILLVNVVNIWSGSSNILTLPGALLSDAYLGRFYTLLLGSIASFLGMGIMTIAAAMPQLRPPSCMPLSDCIPASAIQLIVLFLALGLLAIGAGCSRPCNMAFGADQFDTTTVKGLSQLSHFYNWWYFSFTIALLVALTGVVYVQTNISWAIGFAIPTACFALAIVTFLLGYPTYILKKVQGSIFISMAKVVVAAYNKRNEDLNCLSSNFYDPPNESNANLVKKESRTERLNFLDKAALITDSSEVDCSGMASNSWRLCSVQQVEQLKSLIWILPVWLAGIICFVAMDQHNMFCILQAIQMSRKVGHHFVIPPAWTGFVSMLALSIWIIIYERIILPLLKRMGMKDVRVLLKERIRTGIVMSVFCMCCAAVVESKRRDAALKAGSSFESPLSIGILVPQLVFSGLIEAFAAVAIMEFFTTQMPESMRSIGGAIFFISLSMSSYLSTVIVNIIHSITGRNGRMPWLGGNDLNKNRLDYFYAIIACLEILNFFYFTFFASKYIVAQTSRSIQETD